MIVGLLYYTMVQSHSKHAFISIKWTIYVRMRARAAAKLNNLAEKKNQIVQL